MYCKSTENITLKYFQFRSKKKGENETFIPFCNRFMLESTVVCSPNCKSSQCKAEEKCCKRQNNHRIERQGSKKRSFEKAMGPKDFKGALSGLRLFLTTENPLKIMKSSFYFTSKALSILKIFKFLC